MSELENNFTQACSRFYEKTTWKNANCKVTDDYKIIMSGELSLKDNTAFEISRSIPYITYKYDIKNIYSILSDVSESQEQEISDIELNKTEPTNGLMGMELKYILEMPGKITKADMGEIEDNRITIDMIDMVEKEHIYVESQELNLLWDLGIVLFILVVIIAVVVSILKNQYEEY